MSVITDFFMATPEDLAKIPPENLSAIYDEFSVVYAKKVDPTKLVTLESIIEKKELNEDEIEIPEPILATEDEWVFPVSEVITQALATWTPSELEEYATVWANTGEWQFDGGTPENIFPLLQEMSDLVKTAKSESQLFVFIYV